MPRSSGSNKKVKAEILRRLEAGERGVDIATSVGVTRQYVSALKKELEVSSAETMLARSKRGRPRNVPFAPSEEDSLREHLRKGQKPDGTVASYLTEPAIKAWFKARHGRTLTVHQLRKFCTEENWRLARPDRSAEADAFEDDSLPAIPPAPKENSASSPTRRKRGRPRKDESPRGEETHSEEMIAAMARANAEVMERLKAQRKAAAPKPAQRAAPKLGRNDPCPFDPKKKFKRCCGREGLTYCKRQVEESAEETSPLEKLTKVTPLSPSGASDLPRS